MSAKLDPAALDAYARAYAARLSEDFFASHDSIGGPDLLQLSEVAQVNLFAVKNLYETWKTSALAFRSPYFDFENQEVKAALSALMNTASQHINIQREAFEPLLTEATRQTLLLLLQPQDYFEQYLRNQPDFTLQPDELKQLLKYTRLHRAIPQGLAERLGSENVYVTQALNWLNELLADEQTLDDADAVIAQFSEKVPLDKASLYKAAPFWGEETPIAAPKPTKSFFDLDEDELPTVKKFNARQEVPSTPQTEPVPIAAPEPEREPEPVLEPTFSANGHANDDRPTAATRLNEQFQSEQPTMHAAFAKDTSTETLADQFQKKPIERIHESISLNHKFNFINQLFNGDSVAYHIAIDDLEHCRSFSEAKELMNRVYGPKYHWRINPDEADEFYEIVQRRFND
ncbi:MAG: hypothetical protein LH606_22025 [Cytophagaceae bacterium]|nr:hypothetical protein [Cytophagaceae bacterium]